MDGPAFKKGEAKRLPHLTDSSLDIRRQSVSSAPKKLQDEKEHVDEIKVKRQGAGNRCPSPGPLEFLGVVGGQANEDDQADAADNKLQHVGVQEDIDYGGDDYPHQSHEAERAERGQVTPGGKAVGEHYPSLALSRNFFAI